MENTNEEDRIEPELAAEMAAETAINPTTKSTAEPMEDYKKKSEQYFDQLLRLQADFSNYRKRSEKEKMDSLAFGRELMLEKIIHLSDVMEQAVKYSRNATDVKIVQQGLEMVASELNRFLKSEGVDVLETVGQKFNPHEHEAVEQMAVENEEDNNKIVEELQKGYKLNGRLLRAARVKVAKK